MTSPIQPAELAFDERGIPYSPRYRDVYHCAAGGFEQARVVFLAGNDLPARWRDRDGFCIFETGFGLGTNFLATWQAWRDDPQRCRRLHFVAVELHPFSSSDLHSAFASQPESLRPMIDALIAHWPPLAPGMHRLHFDDGAVTLTLLFGDARELLPQLDAQADAFFLDGFAPARNPELWSNALMTELARLAAPGATLATWSVNGGVRRALAAAGFRNEKKPGFDAKRERLTARFEGSARRSRCDDTPRHAIVLGAGLAGSSVANRLAERGWQVDVIERHTHAGSGASGNLAGVLRPLPSLDDNPLARITRAGSLYAMRHIDGLRRRGQIVRAEACGVIHLARDARQEGRFRAILESGLWPEDIVRHVDAAEASAIADWPLEIGGWWFPGGGWVRPPDLCEANLAAWPNRIRVHYGCEAYSLQRSDGLWAVDDRMHRTLAQAPIVIIANGADLRAVPQAAQLPVRAARGQVSHLAVEGHDPLRVVVCRSGYVSPVIDGTRSVGATFDIDDRDLALRECDHAANLAKLERMLPGHPAPGPGQLDGRAGLRPASPDRLPLVGALPPQCADMTDGLYVLSGFGARGLVWSSLLAEVLASRLTADPVPLERDLLMTLDPARFTNPVPDNTQTDRDG